MDGESLLSDARKFIGMAAQVGTIEKAHARLMRMHSAQKA